MGATQASGVRPSNTAHFRPVRLVAPVIVKVIVVASGCSTVSVAWFEVAGGLVSPVTTQRYLSPLLALPPLMLVAGVV